MIELVCLLIKCLIYLICVGCSFIWINQKYLYLRKYTQSKSISRSQYITVIGKTILESIPLVAAMIFISFLLSCL